MQIFWKTKTFSKKLQYRFLVETTKIENTSFSFKSALSEANVNTDRMATTKWTYQVRSLQFDIQIRRFKRFKIFELRMSQQIYSHSKKKSE